MLLDVVCSCSAVWEGGWELDGRVCRDGNGPELDCAALCRERTTLDIAFIGFKQ